jgi:uncharacterized protein YjbJ (UPF0337 family)
MAGKKIEGKVEQVKGRARVAVGKVTGKRSTQLKGKAQQAKGKIKQKHGKRRARGWWFKSPGCLIWARGPRPYYKNLTRREVS